MDWDLLYKIIPYVVTLAIGIFGTYFAVGKAKIAQIKKVVDVISDAVKDDNITESEARAIVTAVREVIGM